MNTNKSDANPSVKCSVTSCQNHCNNEDCCALDRIEVGADELNPTACQCVNRESFVARNS